MFLLRGLLHYTPVGQKTIWRRVEKYILLYSWNIPRKFHEFPCLEHTAKCLIYHPTLIVNKLTWSIYLWTTPIIFLLEFESSNISQNVVRKPRTWTCCIQIRFQVSAESNIDSKDSQEKWDQPFVKKKWNLYNHWNIFCYQTTLEQLETSGRDITWLACRGQTRWKETWR